MYSLKIKLDASWWELISDHMTYIPDCHQKILSSLLQGLSPILGLFLSPKVELAHILPYTAGFELWEFSSLSSVCAPGYRTAGSVSPDPRWHCCCPSAYSVCAFSSTIITTQAQFKLHPDWFWSWAQPSTSEKDGHASHSEADMSIRGMALLSSFFLSFTEPSQSPHGETKPYGAQPF